MTGQTEARVAEGLTVEAEERWHDAMRQMLDYARNPKPAPNVPGCNCRNPDEAWDDVDEDAPVVLCLMHEKRWGAISRDTAISVLLDYEAGVRQAMDLSMALWLGCDCPTSPAELDRNCCCEEGTVCYITTPGGAPSGVTGVAPAFSSPPEPFDEADYMCPNCQTPWKCNGPHDVSQTPWGLRQTGDTHAPHCHASGLPAGACCDCGPGFAAYHAGLPHPAPAAAPAATAAGARDGLESPDVALTAASDDEARQLLAEYVHTAFRKGVDGEWSNDIWRTIHDNLGDWNEAMRWTVGALRHSGWHLASSPDVVGATHVLTPATDSTLTAACPRCGIGRHPATGSPDQRCTEGGPANWCETHGWESEVRKDERARCPAGCGCTLWTDDADRRECACDGPCCYGSWDEYVAAVRAVGWEPLAKALHATGLNTIGRAAGHHGRYTDQCICNPDARAILAAKETDR